MKDGTESIPVTFQELSDDDIAPVPGFIASREPQRQQCNSLEREVCN